SCRSGEFVASRLDGNEYDVYEIFARFGKWQLVAMKKKDAVKVPFPEGARPEIDKTDFSVKVYGEKVKFDYAYIVQHGSPGENGLMQGYLEMLGIPCSTSSAFVSAIAFDKYACKNYFREVDFVKCAPDVFVRNGMDVDTACKEIVSKLAFPVFVKPTEAGSSFGITKVSKPEDLPQAINFAFSEGSTVLVEQGVKGRELTCAAYKDSEGVKALPVIEIVTENDYFDYDAKYNGFSQEICPAPIDETLSDFIKSVSKRIYSHLGCAGVVRMDYILGDDGLYFLEINTIPGMTSASLVPKMVRTAGIDITDFLSGIIESS
ncbi:MAG: ATP-grasp domain-containing protein, partial [Bacteroidales bacterium]|nr:ATP-grasp domain-containing protein [Bacteroidales bacterium]